MNRIKLQDGIFLNIIQSDKFKTEYFDINIILPLCEETASHAALLPLVLKRGSKNYPTMADITKRFDYLYSTGFSSRIVKRGEAQIIAFTVDFLRDAFVPKEENLAENVFEIVRDILFCPLLNDNSFKNEYVESEKKNLIDIINSLINNKNAYAMKKCHSAMCEGQNYAVNENGKVEIVEKITGEELFDFYNKLLETSQIELFYNGISPEDKVIKLANSLVKGIKRGKINQPHTIPFVQTRQEVNMITEEMAVAQGKLIMGFYSNHFLPEKNCTAYSVFNELYGGSPTSKLFENVREKLSLCYYCRSISDTHKGILTVASGIEVENFERAKNEIVSQLELTKNGIIAEEEIESAKKSLINAYRELYDDGTSLCSWYLSRILGGDYRTIEDVISEIQLVTKEQIIECAKSTQLDTVFFLKGTLNDGGHEE